MSKTTETTLTASTANGETHFAKGSNPELWRNNHNKNMVVEFVCVCEMRFAESKSAGVIYIQSRKYCVRSLDEFKCKFTRIES